MASIRARSDTGLLFFDIRYEGVRCREQTTLPDSPANRQKMSKVLRNIEKEIEACSYRLNSGQFEEVVPV
jgi:integrase